MKMNVMEEYSFTLLMAQAEVLWTKKMRIFMQCKQVFSTTIRAKEKPSEFLNHLHKAANNAQVENMTLSSFIAHLALPQLQKQLWTKIQLDKPELGFEMMLRVAEPVERTEQWDSTFEKGTKAAMYLVSQGGGM